MSHQKLLLIASKFLKLSNSDYEYDPEQFDEDIRSRDYSQALDWFETDYLKGASLEDLIEEKHKLNKEFLEIENDERMGDRTPPGFLTDKQKLIEKYIQNIKNKF